MEYGIQSAIDAADYALDCLVQAQRSMNDSSTASVLDRLTAGFFTCLIKYAALSASEVDRQPGQYALENIRRELQKLL